MAKTMAKIPTVTLNNGVKMPQLGLGVFLVPNDQVEQPLEIAFENGYRLIDTAAAYDNEEGVGVAIRNSGIPRQELFITTKLWNTAQGYEKTMMEFEASLDRLNLDYVDLYLIHWPCPQKGLFVQTWKAFEKIYKTGHAKAIGVCNFKPQHLDHLMQATEIVPAVLQIELNPRFTQEKVRQYAKKHAIHVESWHPLGGQKNLEAILSVPLIVKLGKKYGKTPAQIVLRWHTQLGLIVIPKSIHAERIKENCNIFDFEMSQEEIDSISALNTDMRFGPDPDTFLG